MIARRAFKRAVGMRRTAVVILGLAAGAMGTTATARPETRTLRIYHINLHESSEITFKRDGKYLPDGLKKANWALRDWRRNQPTTMDPRLLDLLWEAYQKSGSHVPIHVIGGFRAPETNKMLRSRSAHTGVAEHSQHMLGKAVDFFIPDVPLAKLREIGLKMQIGGVGFYPRSGAPFVHFDVGSGRYWPRMSRQELTRIFPDGKTIHLPADGKPLPGYEVAMASYKKRKGASELMVADAGSTAAAPRRSFLAALFGGGRDEAEDEADAENTLTAKRAAPAAPAAAPPAEPKPQKPAALPPGAEMPGNGGFDASAPAKAPAAAEETLVAALQPERVPLPTHAPARAPVAEAPPPAVPEITESDEALVAALTQDPEPALPAAFAHGVPTPRERPVVEALMAQATSAAPPRPEPEPLIASAFAAPAPAVPHARPVVLEASLDTRPHGTSAPAHSSAATIPSPRGGRVTKTAAAPAPRHAHRPAGSQTAIAALLADPERRALEEGTALPDAGRLVAERPGDVLALGFAPTGGRPGSTARFTGRAVNFLPVHHLD